MAAMINAAILPGLLSRNLSKSPFCKIMQEGNLLYNDSLVET